ncbi:MAG: redoxin domain-containing protein [Planctomycetaceae bacterium]|nr:redoxin domain-containing protein [Planctomycetaceae bacterium]
MKRTWCVWCLQLTMTGLLVGGWEPIPAGAQDAKQQESAEAETKEQDEKPATLREQYQAIMKEYNQAVADIRRQLQNPDLTADERKAIVEGAPNAEDLAEKINQLIAAEPKSDVALEAHMFLARSTRTGKVFDAAIAAVFENFADSERLAELASVVPMGTPVGDKLLNKILEVSPHDSVKGKVTYTMANMLSRSEDQESEKRCIELLETIQAKYAAIEVGRGQTLGKLAERLLFAVQNLRVGKVAPDIVAKDLDEVEFKLSDYRGKVVVLDFWGDW